MPKLSFFDARSEALSSHSAEQLKRTSINHLKNVSVVDDVELLFEYIGEDGLPTGGKNGLLPIRKLDELNARMTRPVVHGLKRPQQKSLPNLNGLFLLLRASGLLRLDGSPPKATLVVDREFGEHWNCLNPTEKYFALLHSWLYEAQPELIGGDVRSEYYYVSELIQLVNQLGDETDFSDERYNPFYNVERLMFVVLMEMFGWLNIEYHSRGEGKGVRVRKIEWLPFGEAMIDAIYRHWLDSQSQTSSETDLGEDWISRFQTYFPELQNDLPQDDWPYQEGEFTWKISLGDVWRRIKAPANLNLDDFALTILSAFEFDDDHLYCFEMRDPRGRQIRFDHSQSDSLGSCTADTELGELLLGPGDTMTFIFDFGDNWCFELLLESTDNKPSKLKHPIVTDKRGKAPDQYPDYEDW